MLKATAPKHMMYGGGVYVFYDYVLEFLRHHDENNLRPEYVDHLFAIGLIGTFTGAFVLNTIRGAFQGFLLATIMVGPSTYWMKKMGTGTCDYYRPINIYY